MEGEKDQTGAGCKRLATITHLNNSKTTIGRANDQDPSQVDIRELLAAHPKNSKIIVACANGRDLSQVLARLLLDKGYTDVEVTAIGDCWVHGVNTTNPTYVCVHTDALPLSFRETFEQDFRATMECSIVASIKGTSEDVVFDKTTISTDAVTEYNNLWIGCKLIFVLGTAKRGMYDRVLDQPKDVDAKVVHIQVDNEVVRPEAEIGSRSTMAFRNFYTKMEHLLCK